MEILLAVTIALGVVLSIIYIVFDVSEAWKKLKGENDEKRL